MTTIEVPATQLEQFEPLIREGVAKFVERGGQVIFKAYTFPDETYDNECLCRCPIAACTVFQIEDAANAGDADFDFDDIFIRTVNLHFDEDNLNAFVTGFDLVDPPLSPTGEVMAFYEFGKRLHSEIRPMNSELLEEKEEEEDDTDGEVPY